MKLSEKLWCDLKSDSEKHSWLLMGMGVSTGVVCHAIQTDLANSYHVKMQVEKERDTYRELCAELLKAAQGYLPHIPISTAKVGGANRHSGMLKASDNLKDAITKAEVILGDNK